ncbi:hypothetical protein C1H46_014275 [Malus baccata]|uniref:Uncharacterized protein n=1 Tax=Malus baccata TaxID=106549 RepID=A0A540MMT5_MALBA|nr:hypothetical protein C1H46_014275 [Malus baccata]
MYEEHRMLADPRNMHMETVKSRIHERMQTTAGALRKQSPGRLNVNWSEFGIISICTCASGEVSDGECRKFKGYGKCRN